MPAPTPFTINVDDEVLADLRARLERTRFPARTPGNAWAAGTDPDYLRDLVAYWANGFDWRAQERTLNAVPQYLADIAGQTVHFVHVHGVHTSNAPTPLPLILSHGWPSAFTEMLALLPLLTDPGNHGGDPADAFDVVVPSLPGYAFSDLPRSGPLTRPVIADLWVRLMTEVLGYERFGAYGGDIGAGVTNYLGALHPDAVIGVHLLHPAMPLLDDQGPPPTEAEHAYRELRDREDEEDGGYSAIQITRPDTIAAALIDSPSGIAAWIVDKYRAWSDAHGDLERRFDRDTLLTLLTLYWVTGTIGSSFRTYYDYRHNPPLPPVNVPAGFTLGTEDQTYPREMAERIYADIRHWRPATVGGHFMPLEEPELLAGDLRAFFRPLRTSGRE
jgi:pimeloyl-ACP methyl ester carboxylesterase